MKASAVVLAVLALAACGGGEAPAETSLDAYSAAACPVDDAALCGRAAAVANALVADDAGRLVELSYADEFRCDELPADLFPDCAPGRTLLGHASTDGDGRIAILSEEEYQTRLASLGRPAVLGVGTCGPDDPDRRSYHLAFEGDEVLGSLELVRREGTWSIGMIFADSSSGWRKQFDDPRAELACGNVQAWD